MIKQDWTTAPEDAQFYSFGGFRKMEGNNEFVWGFNGLMQLQMWKRCMFNSMDWHKAQDDFEMKPEKPEEECWIENLRTQQRLRRGLKK